MKKATKSAHSARSASQRKDSTVDDYLAAVPEDARAGLEKLRKIIKTAAPEAVEVISYRIPAYKYHGMLVGFAAFPNHCSLFVMSLAVMAAHRDDLKPYDTATATIHFPAAKPLPAALVKKLVRARIQENEARFKAKAKHSHAKIAQKKQK